jgi:3'(2'), 5'-bisphosphate nucleotidase
MPYETERRIAIEAVREASTLCRAVQAEISPDVLAKKDKSPVTVADFGSQALVCKRLAEAFPNDPVIAEEDSADLAKPENELLLQGVTRHVRSIHPGADPAAIRSWIDHGGATTSAARFWTLDPIDGTKGFLRKEQYAVALGLLVNGRVDVAALACPNLPHAGGTGAILVAVRGQGAFACPLDDGPNGKEEPIRVSSTHVAAGARFCESVESGHSAHGDSDKIASMLGITAEPIRLDSQAKYGVVARGEAELYLRMPTRADYREKIWDHAAGTLIVEEAGGRVTDIDGKPLDFGRGRELSQNRGVVVGNGPLLDAVLGAIRSLGL